MTTKLARIAERDGLVFLCDKDGKELPDVCLAPRSEIVWISQSPATAQQQIDRWAAEVDISEALVKVPEKVGGTLGPDDFGDGWNACLDELEGK